MATSRLSLLAHDLRRLVAGEPSDEVLLDAFRRGRDEQAFATLVRRHGSLVMGVCRRALAHEQDAEDAFQATFLVLARNASAIRQRDSIAGWLHGVSHRIAMNAKRTLAKRRRKEQQGARPEASGAADDLTWGEVRGLLDEEVAKLPEVYRTVFVLCCLQEMPRPEAAKRLGLQEGTVSSRLARAKERLHEALTRRGVTLSVLMATLGLGYQAKLGAAVLKATARVAVADAAGASGVVPARVALLAAGDSMLVTKATMATALVVLVGMALAPLVAQAPGGAMLDQRARDAKGARDDERADITERKEIEGRVLDPDGKPVKGATVALRVTPPFREVGTTAASTTTDADGRFRLANRADQFHTVTVVATAPGFGPEWATPGGKPVTLRLAKDHTITGKVVDLEGRPVPNARLRVLRVKAPKEGGLESAIAKHDQGEWPFRELEAQALPDRLRSARTDAKGLLRLDGLGHGLIVAVIEGPTIASKEVWILNGPATAPRPKKLGPVYLAAFTHAGAPTRPVVGVVRDSKTKKPLAGVTVRSEKIANQSWFGSRFVETKTDAEGKYRLIGMPTGKENWVVVAPPADQPYLALQLELPDPVGIEPMTLDVDLRPGVWAEGRVTVKETGQPVPHVKLQYFALAGNPYLAEVVGAFRGRLHNPTCWTSKDGKYRLPVLPGEGALVGWAHGQYMTLWEQPGVSRAKLQTTVLQTIGMGDLHYFARVNPKGDADRLRHDLTLWKGEALKVKLVDPEGKPVAGALASRAESGVTQWEGPLASAECVVGAINRKSPRRVEFVHLERNLAGALKVPDDGTSDVVVQLRPAGTILGQLVEEGGKPRPGVQMHVIALEFPGPMGVPAAQPFVRTGGRGEFRVTGLLPGVQYVIGPTDGGSLGTFQLKEGETKDLGKVKQPR